MLKMMKKLTAVFVILTMLLSVMPMSYASETVNSVTINFAAYDGTTNTFLYVPQELTVTEGIAAQYGYTNAAEGHEVGGVDHSVKTGEISALDALVAAHIDRDGDASGISGSGSYASGIFGKSGGIGFTVDGVLPVGDMSDGYTANEYVLKDGETVLFFLYGDAYWGDYTSYFDRTELSVNTGEEFSLYLEGYSAMELMWGTPGEPTAEITTLQPIANAEICLVNAQTGALEKTTAATDAAGKVTYSFDTAGEYIVTATGTVGDDYGDYPIVAPVCFVTVTDAPVQTGYDVTVKVGTSDVNVKFYHCAGFDEEGCDILGEEIAATDNGVAESYHVYTMRLEEGTYSYRATDAEGNSLGGMTFDVDGTEASAEIALRRVDVYSTTKVDSVYVSAEQYTTEVLDGDGRSVTAGAPYVNTYTRYPYLLLAKGNAELYTVKLIPSAEMKGEPHNLGTNTMLNYSVSKGATLTNKSGTLPTLIKAVVTAPTGSKVQVFNQLRNFYTEEVPCYTAETGDTTTSYTYRLPKNNGSHTYRVSAEGKITKAGYLKLTSEDVATVDITFGEHEDPKIRPTYDTSTAIGSRMEDSILLNINSQNYLRMNMGDTFKARAYRAWEIINGDTANIIIEPDFAYKIISGDSVTLSQQGQNAMLEAVKEGVSVIEVTYDAIEIGGNTSYTGLYGAIDPMRKGLFIVNVEGNTDTEITMPEWDSDFDTVYFLGESGTYRFAPTSSAPLTVTCNGAEVSANDDASYTLPINQGNNIVTVTAGNTTEYTVIKGKKVTANIENVTSPEQPVKQGDTVKISFSGLHMPLPKFAGIYNPGYGGTAKISYTTDSGGSLSSAGTQYNFINNHAITFTAYEKGRMNLTGGHIALTNTGYEPNSHRELTDTGVGANFNAATSAHLYSVLPDLSLEVAENPDLSYMENAAESFCNLSKVEILCGTSTFMKSFGFTLNNETKASAKNSNTTFSGINAAYPFTVSATPVNDGVTMKFRYWELGDAGKTEVPLTAGETLTLVNSFTGEKPIYMEIEVTPSNPVFGDGEVYSYVAYKSTAGFERPILKTLKVTDGEGNAFAAPYGVLYSDNKEGISYTETEYYCYVPKETEAVTLSLARLIGTADATIGEETLSVATSEVAFSPIGTEADETTVTIQLADSGSYTLKLIKAEGIHEKSIVHDGEKIAVSFKNTEDMSLRFYLVSYEEGVKVRVVEKEALAGENAVYLYSADFAGLKDVTLLAWDEDMKPLWERNEIK